MDITDIIIIGAGPAGLSAALYAARSGLDCLVFEKGAVGGLITQTTEIDNYPAAPENSTGASLTERMRQQAAEAGCKIISGEVLSAAKGEGGFTVVTDEPEEYKSKALIIASGSLPRLLGIPGEGELRGRGVSYCA
ncbi:MAG: FAD-dependent oxidoreductase, partial [Eubacteriaceae bacterium]|nr:FAD-dependent oxidoreductase [Eubacteriaceae bacterium]